MDSTLNLILEEIATDNKDDGGDKSREVGLRDWSIALNDLAFVADSGQAALQSAYENKTKINVYYESSLGDFKGVGILTSQNEAAAVNDVVKDAIAISGDKALIRIPT